MANNLIDDLLKLASSSPAPAADISLNPASEALRSLTTQVDALRNLYQNQVVQTAENTAAVVQNTGSRTSEAATAAAGIARTVGSSLGSGITLLPLISGIAKLFGLGGESQPLTALTPFALPGAVTLDGGVTQSGSSSISAVSYGQNGLPRVSNVPGAAPTTISVNVQTIDSRSFLDHSEDIARAVREAMLNSSPLNDVIAEI